MDWHRLEQAISCFRIATSEIVFDSVRGMRRVTLTDDARPANPRQEVHAPPGIDGRISRRESRRSGGFLRFGWVHRHCQPDWRSAFTRPLASCLHAIARSGEHQPRKLALEQAIVLGALGRVEFTSGFRASHRGEPTRTRSLRRAPGSYPGPSQGLALTPLGRADLFSLRPADPALHAKPTTSYRFESDHPLCCAGVAQR